MSKDNVTPISKPQSDITLANVSTAINAWRQTRKRANEKMPGYLWDQVLSLLKFGPGPDSKILAALSLSRPQLEAEKQRRQSIMSSAEEKLSAPLEELDFCDKTHISNEQPWGVFLKAGAAYLGDPK